MDRFRRWREHYKILIANVNSGTDRDSITKQQKAKGVIQKAENFKILLRNCVDKGVKIITTQESVSKNLLQEQGIDLRYYDSYIHGGLAFFWDIRLFKFTPLIHQSENKRTSRWTIGRIDMILDGCPVPVLILPNMHCSKLGDLTLKVINLLECVNSASDISDKYGGLPISFCFDANSLNLVNFDFEGHSTLGQIRYW
eukprot:TRINITY_DN3122_c0_g2_i1.p1 TRINITY_DN3122_c0_g2~~TRINITY_DN3122_c0_g2_i1.p1  ORF type:complete len:198 (-),score=-0.23 TRINITY_DN3122_c0_g2_i1:534-1127(-)